MEKKQIYDPIEHNNIQINGEILKLILNITWGANLKLWDAEHLLAPLICTYTTDVDKNYMVWRYPCALKLPPMCPANCLWRIVFF